MLPSLSVENTPQLEAEETHDTIIPRRRFTLAEMLGGGLLVALLVIGQHAELAGTRKPPSPLSLTVSIAQTGWSAQKES